MYKLAVVFFCLATLVVAQDRDIYGRVINTHRAYNNPGKVTGRTRLDHAFPILMKHRNLMKRQIPVPERYESCTRKGQPGRCKHFESCPEVLQTKYLIFTSLHNCANDFEICCPDSTS